MNKINLQDIVGGQLQAKFERSFEKVIENLQDLTHRLRSREVSRLSLNYSDFTVIS